MLHGPTYISSMNLNPATGIEPAKIWILGKEKSRLPHAQCVGSRPRCLRVTSAASTTAQAISPWQEDWTWSEHMWAGGFLIDTTQQLRHVSHHTRKTHARSRGSFAHAGIHIVYELLSFTNENEMPLEPWQTARLTFKKFHKQVLSGTKRVRQILLKSS